MNEQTGGTDRLRSLLTVLASKRRYVDGIKKKISDLEAEMAKSQAWKDVVFHREDIRIETEQITKVIEEIRETGHEVAVELDDKTPAPGLTIRKKTTFEITDDAAATAWAKEHLPMAFKLDKPLFTKLVKAMPDDEQAKVSGVSLTTDEFGDVRIATDLSEYLSENEISEF